MRFVHIKTGVALLTLWLLAYLPSGGAQSRPNIVFILADDLGYGDVSYFNRQSKINTPHLDALAREGMVFTDAHSNSSVCTPTRYGILTGRYAWRSPLQSGVLWSYDTLLIRPNQLTAASLLKKAGYQTACIGKWHLGMNWIKNSAGQVDFSKPLSAGPNQLGFDYFFGITSSLDIPPYVYIRNDHLTATILDSTAGREGQVFWRPGPIGDDFRHDEVLPRLVQESKAYLRQAAQSLAPFFLYLALPSPHTPILPLAPYAGTSGTNAYGDFVVMTDALIGQMLQVLEETGLAQNTVVIFTADNGCSPMADFAALKAVGHAPSYLYRGAKADIYEGGHRVPFIVRWPGHIQPATTQATPICLTDFVATAADIAGVKLTSEQGPDSYSLLPLWLQRGHYKRTKMVHHSIDGVFALRQKNWKIIFSGGSGGWSEPTTAEAKTWSLPSPQVYRLDHDPEERHNLAGLYPRREFKLTARLQKIIRQGRSTPGPKLKNEVEIKLNSH